MDSSEWCDITILHYLRATTNGPSHEITASNREALGRHNPMPAKPFTAHVDAASRRIV